MTPSTPELPNSLIKQELLALLEEKARRQERKYLSKSLPDFVRLAWPILEPVTKLSWNWHLDLICEYLTLIKEGKLKGLFGKEGERVIFNVPPRTMKSFLVPGLFPVWDCTTDPPRR